MSTVFPFLRFLPIAAVCIVVSGCFEVTNAVLFVDNASESPYQLDVDGETVATIPSDSSHRLVIPLGKHHFKVTCEGETVFEAMKEIGGGQGVGRKRYLLNPDNQNRYAKVTVQYGDDPLAELGGQAVANFASYMAGHDPDQIDRNKVAHLRLRDDAIPSGDAPWFEIPGSCRVLEGLPKIVFTKRNTKKMSTLVRIPHDVHDYLVESRALEDVTEDDVMELLEVQQWIETTIPFE